VWQTGVPVTGNAAASDQKKSMNVTIEDEKRTIDLHQEDQEPERRKSVAMAGAAFSRNRVQGASKNR
jgi:hypothetical protein